MDQDPASWRPSDLEAYCYLRRFLPPGHSVQAEPTPEYFSEWQFRYLVCRGEQVIAELAGDFREIRPGSLAAAAIALVERATNG